MYFMHAPVPPSINPGLVGFLFRLDGADQRVWIQDLISGMP
jgi:hypothetical protein